MATLCGVISESGRIINDHSCHFRALSYVFLMPIAFFFCALPTLHLLITKSATNPTEILILYTPHQYRIGLETLSISLLYTFIVLSFFLCATGIITYSVYQEFVGRPVKFESSIKSLSNSLFRLFITFLCALIITLAVLILVGSVLYLVIKSIEFLGIQLTYFSPYFTIIYVMGWLIFGLGFMYLQVNWVLASVIVVVESSWGFEALRRSACLVRGMRGVALFLILFHGGLMSAMLLSGIQLILLDIWTGVMFVFQIVFLSFLVTEQLQNSVVANTVLHMHCKSLHGELVLEKIEEDY